jgi:putative DNA primase/helicase
MSRWIWEVSELGATTRRADVEALKSFITLCDVSVRKPYGRRDVQGPAVCSLIGTLNDTGAGFLNDPTGTRRALTISLARIDWSYTDRVDVNQVWAQAVSLYRAGESPYLLADERETQAKINAEFETVDPVDDVLATELEINPKQFDWVTPSAEVLRIVDERLKGTSAQHARSIAAALKKRGIEAARPYINGAQVRGYRGIRLRKIDELARLQDATRRQVST